MRNGYSSAVGAEEFLPVDRHQLASLRRASAGCRGCGLFEKATQTVFGAGDPDARVMLVGEQPGDREDRDGAPFVGPAGRILDDALVTAGLDKGSLYVTNAVKHFKWEASGQRRLHKKPSHTEVVACRPWLLAEIEAVGPDVVVCMGATAARSLLGPEVRVTRQRGQILPGPGGTPAMMTVHPSAILRADPGSRQAELERFAEDLRRVARYLAG